MRYNDLYYNDKSFYDDNLTAKILISYSNQGVEFPVCPLSGDIFKFLYKWNEPLLGDYPYTWPEKHAHESALAPILR
mgnify:CR=1 FL=1